MKDNKTKIVATIGPATESKEVLKEMMLEGMNVARLNFSHGKYDILENVISSIRELDKELGRHTAILADLQGPKIRIGEVENDGFTLVTDDVVEIVGTECISTPKKIYISYENIGDDLKVGDRILINDGKVSLVCEKVTKKEVKARVLHGGWLTSKKGVNLPDTSISLPSLTKKDLQDLAFALKHEISWIALSFVRSENDIIILRNIISQNKKDSRIIAKIEKPEALKNIESIIKEADGIMVARGDLGVEIPMQEVPLFQKDIVKMCQNYSKPVIIATQMMESMINEITPTRAEVNDVANAVLDGADAVMLSAETSVGKYPVVVIQAMYKIIKKMESTDKVYYTQFNPIRISDRVLTDAICSSAVDLSKRTGGKAINAMTFSGYTAFKISSYRPEASIFVFTGNEKILNMLSLVWGVKGFYYNKFASTDDTIEDTRKILEEKGYINKGETFINVASMPIEHRGTTNMLKVSVA